MSLAKRVKRSHMRVYNCDHQIDGSHYAGRHLLLEFLGARYLDEIKKIESALISAAQAAGAHVLDVKLHKFSKSGGVTGVVLLAESHISIHTWPEHEYAAIDVFMCGACNPNDSIESLRASFQPTSIEVINCWRGLMPVKMAPAE